MCLSILTYYIDHYLLLVFYNHKLLIEGYTLDTGSKSTIYQGVDLFAEFKMQRIGSTDFLYNISSDEYRLFALDTDAPNSHTGGNDPTTVFLVKVDHENEDFQNEQYVLKFRQLNDLNKYFRVRATLTTEDETITPALESYKVKLG